MAQQRVCAAARQALLARLGGEAYDQAIVLGYRGRLTPPEADSRSMLTLLALNRAWAGPPTRPRVVAEMLEGSNVAIAQNTGVDDFIVSDELSSLMLAHLSERLELQDVFAELFDPDGCYLSLQPAPHYAPAGATTFASVVATALSRGASAIGYRLAGSPVVLNPAKSTPVTLGELDEVLVLAPRELRPAAPVAEPVPAADEATTTFGPILLAADSPHAPRITETPRQDGFAALNDGGRVLSNARPNPNGRHARADLG